jgi:hypothetical protein
VDSGVEKQITVYMDEYKIRASELLVQMQVQNNQTQFLQVYAAVLTGLAGVAQHVAEDGIGAVKRFSLPSDAMLIVLVLAAMIAFVIATTAMSAAYMILVLRKRCAELERRINDALRSHDALAYESHWARLLLEQKNVSHDHYTPQLMLGVLRGCVLLATAALLTVVGWSTLRKTSTSCLIPPEGLVYGLVVLSVAVYLIWAYARLYLETNRSEMNLAIATRETLPPWSPFKAFGAWAVPSALVCYSIYLGMGVGWACLTSRLWNFESWGIPIHASILIYSFLTSSIALLPSELPIFLRLKDVEWLTILLPAAAGKGLATVGIVALVMSGKKEVPSSLRSRIPSIDGSRSGWLVYFICQATPFFPMRTSTWILAAMLKDKRSAWYAGGVAALGTIPRMLLVYAIVMTGYDMWSS